MAQLFEIKKVVVGPKNLEATVELAPSAPLMTREDLEGTTRVWEVMPQLRDHVCLGDESGTFGDVMGNTELAHLLEHVTVELLARTDIAGDISCGQTAEAGERTYKLTFKCPDDVLVVGALSSAAWLMQWAFSGGGDPKPDADAIASGLVDLVKSLPEVEEEPEDELVPVPEEEQPAAAAGDACEEPAGEAPAADPEPEPVAAEPQEPVAEPVPAPEPETPAVDEAEVEAILAADPVVPEEAPELVANDGADAAEVYGDAADNCPASDFPGLFSDPEPWDDSEPEDEADEVFEPEANDEVDVDVPAAVAASVTQAEPVEEPEVAPAEPEPQPAPEPEPEPEPEAPSAPANDWGFDNVPRPHVVR